MILDTAAGVLIAALIVGVICLGLIVVDVQVKTADSPAVGWLLTSAGLLASAVLVIWRIMRAHG